MWKGRPRPVLISTSPPPCGKEGQGLHSHPLPRSPCGKEGLGLHSHPHIFYRNHYALKSPWQYSRAWAQGDSPFHGILRTWCVWAQGRSPFWDTAFRQQTTVYWNLAGMHEKFWWRPSSCSRISQISCHDIKSCRYMISFLDGKLCYDMISYHDMISCHDMMSCRDTISCDDIILCIMPWHGIVSCYDIASWNDIICHDMMWCHGMVSWHDITSWHDTVSWQDVISRYDIMSWHDSMSWYDITSWRDIMSRRYDDFTTQLTELIGFVVRIGRVTI